MRESSVGLVATYGSDPEFGSAGAWFFAHGLQAELTLTGFRHPTMGDTAGVNMGIGFAAPLRRVFPVVSAGLFIGESEHDDHAAVFEYGGLGLGWVLGRRLIMLARARYFFRFTGDRDDDFGVYTVSLIVPLL